MHLQGKYTRVWEETGQLIHSLTIPRGPSLGARTAEFPASPPTCLTMTYEMALGSNLGGMLAADDSFAQRSYTSFFAFLFVLSQPE